MCSLPDALPSTSTAYARMLVQTVRCDITVQQMVKADFKRHPLDLRTIKRLRIEAALARLPVPDMEPAKPHEGYYATDVSDRLRERNAAFLGLLKDAYPERFA